MTPMICPAADPAGYTVQVDLTVTAAGSPPVYSFSPADPSDPAASHLQNDRGDLDFTDTNQAVAVIMTLKDPNGLGLQFANSGGYKVLAFAKDRYGQKRRIALGHFQFRRIDVDSTGTVLHFCYRNTQLDDVDPRIHHLRSQYGIYLIDSSQTVSLIDPGVGNGGNK